jgi:hypothetical protein
MDHMENTAFNDSSTVACRSVSADMFLAFLAPLVWKDFGDTYHQMLVLFHEVTNGPHKGSFSYN